METQHEEELAKRLKSFRIRFVDRKQFEGAAKLGFAQSTFNKYESGKIPITLELVSILITKYQLNVNWLITGKGAPQDKTEKKSNITTDISSLKGDIDVILKGIKFLERNQSMVVNKLLERISAIERSISHRQGVN